MHRTHAFDIGRFRMPCIVGGGFDEPGGRIELLDRTSAPSLEFLHVLRFIRGCSREAAMVEAEDARPQPRLAIGDAEDIRRIQPAADRHGNRMPASEPPAHRPAEQIAERLRILIEAAKPDFPTGVEFEIPAHLDTPVGGDREVGRRERCDSLEESPLFRFGRRKVKDELREHFLVGREFAVDHRQDRFSVRGEDKTLRETSPAQGPNADPIAGDDQAAPAAIEDRKGEVSFQARRQVVSIKVIGGQHQIGIRRFRAACGMLL